MDGDSRGGAALSVREISGKPIKFVGTGEKLEALEPFYPDRLAGRILGMGAPTSPSPPPFLRAMPCALILAIVGGSYWGRISKWRTHDGAFTR